MKDDIEIPEKIIKQEQDEVDNIRKAVAKFEQCTFSLYGERSDSIEDFCRCDIVLSEKTCDCKKIMSSDPINFYVRELENGGDEDYFGVCVCGNMYCHSVVRYYHTCGIRKLVGVDGKRIILLAHS